MRGVIYVIAFLGMLSLGAWAYSENYDMRARQRQVADLQAQIGALRDAIGAQNAEWAYLNRPARLRSLADLNFEALLLMPLEPAQLGSARALAYPAPGLDAAPAPALDLSQSVTISADLNADPEESAP